MFSEIAKLIPECIVPNVVSFNGYVPSNSLEETSRTLVLHSIKSPPPPEPPRTLSEPYGNLCFPKLIRSLHSSDVIVRRKAAVGLVQLCQQQEERAIGLLLSGTPDGDPVSSLSAMVRALQDTDPGVRMSVAVALKSIAATRIGEDTFYSHSELLPTLLGAVGDGFAAVVYQVIGALLALSHASREYRCMQRLLDLGGAQILLRAAVRASRCDDGSEGVTPRTLQCLAAALDLKEGAVSLVRAGAAGVSAHILATVTLHPSGPLLPLALLDFVAQLSCYPAGRRAVVAQPSCTGRILGFIVSIIGLISLEETSDALARHGLDLTEVNFFDGDTAVPPTSKSSADAFADNYYLLLKNKIATKTPQQLVSALLTPQSGNDFATAASAASALAGLCVDPAGRLYARQCGAVLAVGALVSALAYTTSAPLEEIGDREVAAVLWASCGLGHNIVQAVAPLLDDAAGRSAEGSAAIVSSLNDVADSPVLSSAASMCIERALSKSRKYH